MKKFVYKILYLIVLPLLLFGLVYEGLARKVPNVYAYKNGWMAKNASSIKILNLGSSHGYFGISPSVFSDKAFNCAHESQDLEYDCFIFSKFFDNMDSLQVLILPISYRTFFEKGIEFSDEHWRVKYYCIYYECPYHSSELVFNSEFYSDLCCRDIHIAGLAKSAFSDEQPELKWDEFGKGIRNRTEVRDSIWWENNGKVRAKYHSRVINYLVVANNMEYVENIVEKCRKKNIQVLMVTIPAYKTYRDNLNQNQLGIMVDCCHLFEEQHDNVCYLNLLADDRFDITDYSDSDHLNEKGAEKLTLILQQTIDSLEY